MSVIATYASNFVSSLGQVTLDDFADKCHYIVSSGIFAIFSLLIGSMVSIGEPLSCFMPSEYPDPWVKYVQSICFVNGTFTKVGNQTDETYYRDESIFYINYYQWVPYMFALQAVSFYLPNYLWRTLQRTSDVDFGFITDQSTAARTLIGAEREKTIKAVVDYVNQACEQSDGLVGYATIIYIMSKFLNLVNALLQLMIINSVVASDPLHFFWGFRLLREMTGGVLTSNPYFPRFGYCQYEQNFKVGQGYVQEVQCALVVNAYNEKAYLMAYFWLLFLSILTFLNAVYTIFYYIVPFTREFYVKQLLKLASTRNGLLRLQGQTVTNFVTMFLGMDGLLILRFVKDHAGIRVAGEIAHELFVIYRKNMGLQIRGDITDSSTTNNDIVHLDNGQAKHSAEVDV